MSLTARLTFLFGPCRITVKEEVNENVDGNLDYGLFSCYICCYICFENVFISFFFFFFVTGKPGADLNLVFGQITAKENPNKISLFFRKFLSVFSLFDYICS